MLTAETFKTLISDTSMIQQRKQLILNFVHEYRRIHEISPTYVEIAIGIGLAANAEGTAHTYTQELVDEGWLKVIPHVARSLIPTHSADATYCEITDKELKRVAKQQRNLRILRRL